MSEQNEQVPPVTPMESPDITSDDKLWGFLSYFFIIAIIVLLMEDKKKRPFIKFHAVQGIALSIVLFVLSFLLSLTGIGACIAPFLWLVMLWPAIGAFQGKYTNIPFVSDFIKKQGWA